MKSLYLPSIETIYINLDSYPNRNQSMVNMLSHYRFSKFKRSPGVMDNGHSYDPVADAHHNAITSSGEIPFLILEDDCVPLYFKEVISYPDDADLLYLGYSVSSLVGTAYNSDIWKVTSTLATHAMLYLSKNGKRFALDCIDETRKCDLAVDQVMAKNLHKINAYVLDEPFWYQADLPDITNKTASQVINRIIPSGRGPISDYNQPIVY